MKRAIALVLAIVTVSGLGQVLCPPAGLVLTTTPPRLGIPTRSRSPDRRTRPECSASTSRRARSRRPSDRLPGTHARVPFSPIVLDAFGGVRHVGIPPRYPALKGFGVFMQAAAADPVQPAGIAFSNSVHPVGVPPRVPHRPRRSRVSVATRKLGAYDASRTRGTARSPHAAVPTRRDSGARLDRVRALDGTGHFSTRSPDRAHHAVRLRPTERAPAHREWHDARRHREPVSDAQLLHFFRLPPEPRFRP